MANVTLYKLKGIFYINYIDNKGYRIRRSLRTQDPDKAEQERKELDARLVLDLEESQPGRITWSKFLDLYDEWAKDNKGSYTYKIES